MPDTLRVSFSDRALLMMGVGAPQVVQVAEDMPERGREEEGGHLTVYGNRNCTAERSPRGSPRAF